MSSKRKNDKKQDEIFAELAARYVERYGSQLRKELVAVSAQAAESAASRAMVPARPAPRTGGEITGGGTGMIDDGISVDGGWTEIAVRTGTGERTKVDAGSGRSTRRAGPGMVPPPEWAAEDEDFDDRIRRSVAAIRRGRFFVGAGVFAAAACLVFALSQGPAADWILGRWGRIGAELAQVGARDTKRDEAGQSAAPPAAANQAESVGGAGAVTTAASTAQGAASPEAAGQARPGAYEVIPLGFTLADGFSIAGVEQDIERTIYYVADARNDDVVITLRQGGGAARAGLWALEIPIGGERQAAYGVYGADYSLLTFERGGVVYEMTCKYDLNTLLGLAQT
ncbi:MAG: hypothetical protein LBU58_03525 [Clostridiales bacterium]|nr:hypothetical protein [Clostridiales bacterium]